MLTLLLAAAAGTALVAADPSPARLLNGPGIVKADDYPLVSLNNDEEGAVTIRLLVDQHGFVTSCQVAQSSGHTALDEQTCAIYRARAQFEPGRDRSGRAAPGFFTQKVTWKLEGEPAQRRPRQPWTLRTTVSFAGDGKFVDCKAAATGLPTAPQDCDELTRMFKELPGAGDAGPRAVQKISELYFYPLAAAKVPGMPMLGDASLVARQVSEIEIDPDGSVISCKGISYAGVASPDRDACRLIERERFEVVAKDSRRLTGTFVVTAYTRSDTVA